MSREAKNPNLTIDKVIWKYLASGNYNDAYVGEMHNKKWVLKKAKSAQGKEKYSKAAAAMDTADRAVRLWNLINLDFPAKKYGDDWIAPFIEGVEPTPDEIGDAIIDLYQRTGRIVADALTPGNFKKTPAGEIICIDIGAALKLEENLEEEKSQASLDFWRETKRDYGGYFNRNSPRFSVIVKTTKALLFLQHFRPDVSDVSKLKINELLVEKLSKAYDTSTTPQDIYDQFPIKLAYFSKLPLLKDIISDDRFTQEQKQNLCIRFQNHQFYDTHKKLLMLLINNFELDISEAIKITTGHTIEKAGDLLKQLSNPGILLKTIKDSRQKSLRKDDRKYVIMSILEKSPKSNEFARLLAITKLSPADARNDLALEKLKESEQADIIRNLQRINMMIPSTLDHFTVLLKTASSDAHINLLFDYFGKSSKPADFAAENPKQLIALTTWISLNRKKLTPENEKWAASIIQSNLQKWIPSTQHYDKDHDLIRLAWKAAGAKQDKKTYIKDTPEEITYRAIQKARSADPPDMTTIWNKLNSFITQNPDSDFTIELKKVFGDLFSKPTADLRGLIEKEEAELHRILAEAESETAALLKGFEKPASQAEHASQAISASAASENDAQDFTRSESVDPSQKAAAAAASADDQSNYDIILDEKNNKVISLKYESSYLQVEYESSNGVNDTLHIYQSGNLTDNKGRHLSQDHPLVQNLGKLLATENLTSDEKKVVEKALANKVIERYEKSRGSFFSDISSSESEVVIRELKELTTSVDRQAKEFKEIIKGAKPEGRLHNILKELGLVGSADKTQKTTLLNEDVSYPRPK